MQKRILNIGCGDVRLEGAVNIDSNPCSKPDVLHDLNILPWPLPDSEFEVVVCSHILEHLFSPFQVMLEIHRVCKSNAEVRITTPHFSSYQSWNDLSHIYHFGLSAFSPFYKGHYNTQHLFSMEKRILRFGTGIPSRMG